MAALPIYLAGVSLHRLQGKGVRIPWDLPGIAADLGFQGVALSDRELAGLDPAAVARLVRQNRDHGCGLILDINADLTLAGADALARELQHVRYWLDQAAANQVSRVRLAIGGQRFSYQRIFHPRKPQSRLYAQKGPTPESCPARIKGLLGRDVILPLSRWMRNLAPGTRPHPARALARVQLPLSLVVAWARRRNIRIGIENHWGVTTHPEELAAILDHFDAACLGSCPDFGNFPSFRNPYQGLRLLAARAVMVHAKSHSFTDRGEETSIDFGRCLAILRGARFKGPLCVEYEGRRAPLAAVARTRDLICRYL